MPVAVLPSGFRTCIPLLQQERTLLGVALFSIVCLFAPHFLPLGVTTGALIFGAAFYLIVGLPYGKEAFFEASVLGESQKHHSALSELGIWKKTIMFSLLLLPFKTIRIT